MFVRKEGNSQTGDRMFAMVWPFLESPAANAFHTLGIEGDVVTDPHAAPMKIAFLLCG